MTLWLERSESRFLDLITTSVHGLVKENKNGGCPDKYTVFSSGAKIHVLFSNIHPTIFKSQIESFASISEGRYIREIIYALVALDFCEDTYAANISAIKIDKITDFKNIDFLKYIQSTKSKYSVNKNAIEFCKLNFASEEWSNFLADRILSYGYFCRYLDILELLSNESKIHLCDKPIYITQLKNLIGPFDHRVVGSGPDFIQETFKSWAFFADIFTINTGGELSNYTKQKRLEYLKKHTGYISDGNTAYEILRNLKKSKFLITKCPKSTIRIMGFMRLANVESWRREFNLTLYSTLRKTRLLFYLNSEFNKLISIKKLIADEKLNYIINHFKKEYRYSNLIEDLLYLECMGYKLEIKETNQTFTSLTEYIFNKIILKKGVSFFEELKSVKSRSIFYEESRIVIKDIKFEKLQIKSIRRFDVENFNKYCPQGEFIQWIQKN